jgi:YfiR/HmsC-like
MPLKRTFRSRGGWERWRQPIRSRRAAYGRVPFCAMALASLLWLVSATATRAQSNPSVEYQVKAAFLVNFAKFIEWPPNAFEGREKPIIVCIFGYDPFGSALDELIQGKSIHNRELLARRVNDPLDLRTCDLVFAGQREEKRLPEILNSVKETSALVVGGARALRSAVAGSNSFWKTIGCASRLTWMRSGERT